MSDSSQFHTFATAARCSGLVMSRLPGSWSHLCPCSRPPWPLPCPVIVDTPQPGLPNLPVASPRLIAASTLSTPFVCCSMPRACNIIPVAEVPHISAASSILAAGTPVMPAAHAAVISATAAAASSKWSGVGVDEVVVEPVAFDEDVQDAPNSAESVPGRTGRNRSAVRARGTTRGSWTISLAPRSRARQMWLVVIGKVSATFEPATHTTSASGMSLHGLGSGRHRELSCSRCRPTPCRSGRCSRGWRCATRGGRTCRRDSSSRWSATPRTTCANASSPCSTWMRRISRDDTVERLGPGDRSEILQVRCRRVPSDEANDRDAHLGGSASHPWGRACLR